MENSVENVESLCFGDGRMKWEKKGGDKRNSKFLLIVAELELIFAWCCGGNIWEAL